MKKTLISCVLILLVCSLFADFRQPDHHVPLERNNVLETRKLPVQSNERDVPQYEFITQPITLMANYYDYMPGSYNSTPVRVQADEFGGVYLVFHGRETVNATRRVYYAYIDAGGTMTNCTTISTTNVQEGYPGIGLDPVTGDPLVSWHADVQAPAGSMECLFTYDLYNYMVGLWLTPFVVIGDDLPSNTPNGSLDVFEWPYVYVGPSPNPDKRRVYVQANNNYSDGDPTENPLIAYADFNLDDLGAQSQLDWTYFTIPVFDNWNQSNPEWIRPFHSLCVSAVDGTIAFFGWNSNDYLYVCYNHNYGEGDWTYNEIPFNNATWNPQNLDGTYFFVDDDGSPYDLEWTPVNAGHATAMFIDDPDQLVSEVNVGLFIQDSDNFFPYETFAYIIKYDFSSDEFNYLIANPEINENAANPNYEWGYNEMYIPWDTDNDGEVDEYSTTGDVLMYNGWPIYYWDNDLAFHENLTKIAVNDEKGWIAQIWQDGLKNRYYNYSGDENYIDWATVAEISIVVSGDNGVTWSEPLVINAKSDDVNYDPALSGMMPCYFYLGDKIQDMGEGWGKIHLMFLDDNSFGSSVQNAGTNLGGTQMYASMKINFGDFDGNDKNTIVPEENVLSNYPNPFNPTTTIKFNVQANSKISIEVFNVKGQKVKQLVNERISAGEHSIVWNGSDDNNRSVASGIYFYKMKTDGRYTETRKMILLK